MNSRSDKSKKTRGKGLFSKHTTYSEGSPELKRERLDLELIALGMKKRPSEPDGCEVVDIRCEKCGGLFEEEYERACVHTCASMPPLCIRCEGATADIKAPRITVRGILHLWAVGS